MHPGGVIPQQACTLLQSHEGGTVRCLPEIKHGNILFFSSKVLQVILSVPEKRLPEIRQWFQLCVT